MMWMVFFTLALLSTLWLVGPLLPAKSQTAKMQITVFIILFIGAALGTYKIIGEPNFQPAPVQTAQEDMSAQIQGMVDGLAARLADDPNDAAGWTRLIRSRIVLGDVEQLIIDHKTMRETFKDKPNIINQISKDSGFDAFAAKALNTP